MNIFDDVLTEAVIAKCTEERAFLMNKDVWGVGELRWAPNIRAGISTVAYMYVSPWLREAIIGCVARHIPKGLVIDTVQHYIWLPGSALGRHNDLPYKASATVYLNRDWKVNYGGILLWEDGPSPFLSPSNYNAKYDRDGVLRVGTETTLDPSLEEPPPNVPMRGLCPRYNTMVVNDAAEAHMVTMVSPTAPESRFTIQIRCR